MAPRRDLSHEELFVTCEAPLRLSVQVVDVDGFRIRA